jgi:subfamily B ATP-binding cassette protein MsbA
MKKVSRKEIANMSAGEFVSAAREPYRRLLGYLKPYRKRFVLGLLAGAVYGVLNGLMVAAVHHVGSEVLPKEEPGGRHGATLAEDWNAEIELPEVRAAVEAVQVSAEGDKVRALTAAEQQSAVQSYQEFRAQIAARRLRGKPAGGVDPLAVQPIDALLPAEFRLVLEGERAMLTGAPESVVPAVGLVDRIRSGVATVFRRDLQPAHLAQARASWQQLLNLPESERRHRTLWARYLLAQTESDKRSRVAQIEAMRTEVASGKFTDVLNLKEAAPPPKSLLSVVLLCAMIPGLMLVRAVFGWFNTYCLTWVSLRVLDDIRGNLFSKVLSQSMEFFNRQKTGDLLQTMLNQTRVAQQALTSVAGEVVKEPISIISALLVLFLIDWKFTLMSFVLFPLCIIPVVLVGRKVRRAGAEEEEEAGAMSVIMQEAFSGIREVKAYNREEYEVSRFTASNQKMLRSMMRWRKALEGVGPLVEVVASMAVAGALVYVWMNGMPASEFIALNGGLVMLYPPAKALSRIPLLLQKTLAATSKIFELMDREVRVADQPGAVALTAAAGRIAFEDVTFFYRKDQAAVRNVTLEIEPQQTVALVGRSGAGKSTLFSLLLRFYDPHGGRILLDGHDIRGLTQESLRNQISVVSQEVFLFHDTIFENIRYGRLDATREEIMEAARRAYAHDFIMEQAHGYETVIGDSGRMLSGGQRQRISIARAILRNTPVLLLDEATSALDAESERHIQQAISDLSRGKTVLAIAHRLSTVIRSDVIVVMEAGAVMAAGTHEELLQGNDIYRRLYSMQFDAREGDPSSEAGLA